MERQGRVLAVEPQEVGTRVTILMSDKTPKVGDSARIRWGRQRSKDSNSLYWVYLSWLHEEGGLKDQGYVTPEEIHESCKGHFLMVREKDKHGIMVIREKSTTELDQTEFTEYMEKVDLLMNSFFGIDSSVFWKEYQDFYSKH